MKTKEGKNEGRLKDGKEKSKEQGKEENMEISSKSTKGGNLYIFTTLDRSRR